MAFLISDIFKREIESCPERVKSFFIRDILSRPTGAETVYAVSKCVNGNTSSTTSFSGDCLDRHQFHSVSLYVPSPTHHHQQLPVTLTAAFQHPQKTFLLPTNNGKIYYFHSITHYVN